MLTPEIVIPIGAMHQLLVENMEATKPRSLDASECLGGNREAKTITHTYLRAENLIADSHRIAKNGLQTRQAFRRSYMGAPTG